MTVLSIVVEGTMVVTGHWSHRPLSSLLLLPHSESVRVHALLTSAASVLRSAVGTGLAGPLTVLAPLHQHLLLHQPPHVASLVSRDHHRARLLRHRFSGDAERRNLNPIYAPKIPVLSAATISLALMLMRM